MNQADRVTRRSRHHARSTTRASSTTPVASGSSRMPAGGSRDRVLPLALAGLAALAHRGAFGADGESSDGAGVALPLDRSVLALARPGRRSPPARPGHRARCSCPRARAPSARARALVEATFARGRAAIVGWRTVPFDPSALGAAAAASRPAFAQAIVARPSRGRGRPPARVTDDAFERRLVVARRRLESAAREAGGASPSCRSRPPRPDHRLQGPRRRRPAGRPVPGPAGAGAGRLRGLPPALRDEHAAGLAARPAVPLDRPQRRDQHGPRQSRAGPRPDRGRGRDRDRAATCWPPARSCRRTAPTRCRSTRRSSS